MLAVQVAVQVQELDLVAGAAVLMVHSLSLELMQGTACTSWQHEAAV